MEHVVLLSAAALTFVGLSRATIGNAGTETEPHRQLLPPSRPPGISSDSLNALAEVTVQNDPFRLSNNPPLARLGSRPAVAPVVGPTKPARPVLTLRGIVGGPPWQAIVDGLPGLPAATVVRVGDHVGDLTIRSVRRDTVIVVGRDTTWKMFLPRQP